MMDFRTGWLGLVLLASLSAVQAPAQAQTSPNPPAVRVLTLQDCYTLALTRSETLAISREEIKIAEAQYWQAVSALFPQISFSLSERIQNSAGSSISGGGDSGGRRDRIEGRLSFTQTLFSGFREFNTAASLQALKRSQTEQLKRDRQLLYLDGATLFYQVLSQENDLRILDEIVANLEALRQELQERVNLGRSRRGDILAAETQLADYQTVREQVKGMSGASRELLSFLIGVPSDRYQLKDTMTLPETEKLDAYLWRSGARPDITAAAESSTAAERELSASKGALLPTVTASGNFLALEEPERQQEWDILISATIPVFDGGLRIAEVKEKEAALRSTRLSFSRARRLAESEVRQTYNTFIYSASQYVALQKALRTARENYEVQKSDYGLGRTSNLDVLNALFNYNNFQRREKSLELQLRSNLVALQVAAGEPEQNSETRSVKRETSQP